MQANMIDRHRAATELAHAGLDTLILFQPEHVSWALGVHPGPAALFRRAGAASVIISADPAQRMAAVLSDLSEGAVRAAGVPADIAYHRIWVDRTIARPHRPDDPLSAVLDGAAQPMRPTTFDASVAFGLLRDQLTALGLQNARLGLDLGFVPAADFALLATLLPLATLLDGTAALRRLRMIKSADEISKLRVAVSLSEAGLARALSTIEPGVTASELGRAYRAGVEAASIARGQPYGTTWEYISVGPDPWGMGRPAVVGDIIKLDVGVVIGGYSSDMARTVACGAPSRAARELHVALRTGLEAGLDRLRPGARLSDVHDTMLNTIRRHGVAAYARGHFGHSVGNDPFSEQWPFISADCDVEAEAGMVLAVEAPHYVDGLGGFIIEDQVLVTSAGIELMSHSPRDLGVYPSGSASA